MVNLERFLSRWINRSIEEFYFQRNPGKKILLNISFDSLYSFAVSFALSTIRYRPLFDFENLRILSLFFSKSSIISFIVSQSSPIAMFDSFFSRIISFPVIFFFFFFPFIVHDLEQFVRIQGEPFIQMIFLFFFF